MAKESNIKQDLKQEVLFIPMYCASTLMYFISEIDISVSKITTIFNFKYREVWKW